MVSLINKQLLLTAYAYLFIMEQQKVQQGSEALQLRMDATAKKRKPSTASSAPIIIRPHIPPLDMKKLKKWKLRNEPQEPPIQTQVQKQLLQQGKVGKEKADIQHIARSFAEVLQPLEANGVKVDQKIVEASLVQFGARTSMSREQFSNYLRSLEIKGMEVLINNTSQQRVFFKLQKLQGVCDHVYAEALAPKKR